jgi:type II secretory pathway component GspD/PulD (secretin)
VQWKFKNSGPNGMDGIGLLGAAAQGLAAAGTGGFSYGLQRSSSDIRMVFDALAKDNKLPIIVCDMSIAGNLLDILNGNMSNCSIVK